MKGERVAPVDLWGKLAERFALIGVQGIVRMAMAGFDVAAWDALAIAAGLPLATLLGGTPRRIPAYNSCGLGLMARRTRSPTRPRSCSPAVSAPSSCGSAIRRCSRTSRRCTRCAGASATASP